ncbi:hypothetical protein JEOAER750_01579 [Jeotgalicoccus aerolatus]|uniref:DUF4064 domain-containing protein n=1 Tax=Jeotgalicoccus aerolatus TaxID=709510 RepID=A0ABS4HKD7_9STAP|nr:DUF4064 domain-containing protein [Jeotgalicoccus aerolatus]MBP1951361.1 hypothetical protein [Jeotgalicoccus aerolatus]GGD98104.1 hypothetical protein GCM10007273_08170 [Jeotgalicoccus aerolatus]CAD2076987.1 hypothetical protein JEOAER750_01579 [Jeotgalicoccus aerolatus]
MAKEYTQTVKPVSRIAEKIFGWFGWIILLLITAGILFFSLVTMNDSAMIDDLTAQMEAEMAGMNLQGADPQAVIDLTISMLGNTWMVALYLVLPLIVAILGLLNMKRRILSGILLLIAAILAAPLGVTLISSLFFVIAAILLFARKDLVIKNESPRDDNTYDERNHANDLNNNRDAYTNSKDRNQRNNAVSDSGQHRQMTDREDDVKIRQSNDSEYGYNDADSVRNDDIESTRQFNRIDDTDDVKIVDNTADTRNNDYKRSSETEFDNVNDSVMEDPSQTRRDNVDRRNRS